MIKQPLTLEIKGNSLDDGPGIRSVVFFKGCPLSCTWCHNPESKKLETEISFDPEACVGSHTCFDVCLKNALSANNPLFIDRDACDLCFECVEQCPSGALERVGHEMEVAEIAKIALKDKPFFDSSGGGVTFSGGEPTLNMEFLADAAKTLKEQGVHVLIETSGQFNFDKFNALVYPNVDLIYFDIKLMDKDLHKKYCGPSNTTILKNFKKLQQQYLAGGVKILPRTPLIPNITDTPENLFAIASMYKELQVTETQLMAYHPMWQSKNLKIGIQATSNSDSSLDKWMPHQRVKECEKIFTDMGIAVI
jgi:pyruvate formate lyase activating enzyme